MKLLKRPLYLDRLKPFIGKNIVKVLTGVRRAGKSTLLQLLKEDLIGNKEATTEEFIEINFESFWASQFQNKTQVYEYIDMQAQKGARYLFLDEIQELNEWEKLVNSLLADTTLDIYLTGSNAHFLSSEFATYLSGRYVSFEVLPLSYSELSKTQDISFEEYLKFGGFPFLLQLPNNENSKLEYLSSIYNTVVLKDVIERTRIRDTHLLKQLLSYVFANIGHTTSARSITNMLKSEHIESSVSTILSYLDALQAALLFFKVPRYDAKEKKLFKTQEKYYCVDVGLRQALYGNNQRDIEQVLENLVYLEFRRFGWNLHIGQYGTHEIDFIATKNDQTIYAQVCYLLAQESTIQREFGPLEQISDNMPKYVFSLDPIARSQNGIKNVNVEQFLLHPNHYLL